MYTRLLALLGVAAVVMAAVSFMNLEASRQWAKPPSRQYGANRTCRACGLRSIRYRCSDPLAIPAKRF